VSTKKTLLSRTQVLLTKIAQLCKEICDIDKIIKTNNIIPRLPESTINTNRNRDSVDGLDIDDQYEKESNNSSHSNPNLHESDLSYNADTVQDCEEHPTQMLSSLIPFTPSPSPTLLPASSKLSELPFELASLDNLELRSDD
jgi:hypothetical protein